ncbi:hypothetical protein BJY00DRAFT_311074 [Aspergillus carlsbadensis]|nr:hypothetical protein BJY00DRAFT_311074 [Aspergillus carlsbadensis]
MNFGLLLIIIVHLFGWTGAVPTGSNPSPNRLPACQKPLVRKEWRTLPKQERRSYLKAVQCLLDRPSLTSRDVLPGAVNRFEDFLGDHILQTNTNFSGNFYPWHRLLIWSHEQALRTCGYAGAQPYWDWTLDATSAESMLASPIFSPTTGFGGNGNYVPGTEANLYPRLTATGTGLPVDFSDRSGGGCIPDGPFANLTINMGPGDSTAYNEWCVRRDFLPSHYWDFDRMSEFTVHNAGHVGVGGLYGVLTDAWASPGDPLFFLHYANMDRLWWSWQSRDLPRRLEDIASPMVAHDYANERGRNVTLDDTVYTVSAANMTVRIRDLVDIANGLLCYEYDGLY